MRSFFLFIQKYHFFLLFLLLEIIAVFIVINSFKDKKNAFINSSNIVSGYINQNVQNVAEYFSLKKINHSLAEENIRYQNLLKSSYKSNFVQTSEVKDSVYAQQYFYKSAKVINNSVNKSHNFITINRGEKHGIIPGMAVVSSNGVVGIIKDVSKNFSLAISVLNTNLGISGKIQKNNYFGSVKWNGRNYKNINLNEIPNHVDVTIGDTIVTSGYSTIFPEGILIGTVANYQRNQGSSFYDITVDLSCDFKNLSYVYVVGNLLALEQQKLEKKNLEE